MNIHTFELQKRVSKEDFAYLRDSQTIIGLHFDKKRQNSKYEIQIWTTQSYKQQGFNKIELNLMHINEYKNTEINGKKEKKLYKIKTICTICISVDPIKFFQKDKTINIYNSTCFINFTEPFIKQLHYGIYDIFPTLEQYKRLRNSLFLDDSIKWYDSNKFTVKRIDYAYDVYYHPDDYLYLINRGRNVPRTKQKKYNQTKKVISDYLTIPACKHPVFKNKSFHISIYQKGNRILKDNPNIDEQIDDITNNHFLRIECQAFTRKIKSLNNHFKFEDGSDLLTLTSPEVVHYIFESILKQLDLTGTHLTYSKAKEEVDNANITNYKKKNV